MPPVPKHQALSDRLFGHYESEFGAVLSAAAGRDAAAPFRGEAALRMQAGAEKYGGSWCEVDLKEDMLEELLDVYNYAVMASVRLDRAAAGNPPAEVLLILRQIVEGVGHILEGHTALPNYEGPTSMEWVEQQADPSDGLVSLPADVISEAVDAIEEAAPANYKVPEKTYGKTRPTPKKILNLDEVINQP